MRLAWKIRKGRSDYYKKQDTILTRVAEFLDGARKKGEELAVLLRVKESARQFLSQSRVVWPDEEGPAGASVPNAPVPPKPIAGLKGAK